jgi:hypothetical protein
VRGPFFNPVPIHTSRPVRVPSRPSRVSRPACPVPFAPRWSSAPTGRDSIAQVGAQRRPGIRSDPTSFARRAPAGRDNVPPRRPVPFLSRPIRRKCPDRTTGLHNPLIAINLSRTLRFRAIWTGDPRGGTTFGRPPYIKCESPVPPGMKFLTGWESWLSTDSSRHRPRAPRPRGQIVSFHSAAVSRFHQARVSTLLETTAEVFSGARSLTSPLQNPPVSSCRRRPAPSGRRCGSRRTSLCPERF